MLKSRTLALVRSPALAAAWLLCLALLTPAASADAPAAMRVEGVVYLGGQAVPNADLVIIVSGTTWRPEVGPDGAFAFALPADDPDTPASEGGREAAAITFALGSSRVAGPRFASGTTARDLTLTFPAVDLVVSLTAVPMAASRAGEAASITANITNRGGVAATNVQLGAVHRGEFLTNRLLGDLGVDATAEVTLTFTVPAVESPTIDIVATATEADAAPADNSRSTRLRVILDSPPLVEDVSIGPALPVAGRPVIITVQASDEDGIASVTLTWDAGTGELTASVVEPPYTFALGPFAAGAEVSYHLDVVDASDPAQTTTTPPASFRVGQPATASSGDGAAIPSAEADDSTNGTSPAATPAPGVFVMLTCLVALAFALRARRPPGARR